jgi:hypothetical protein
MQNFKKYFLNSLFAIGVVALIITACLFEQFLKAAYVVFVEWLRYLIWS